MNIGFVAPTHIGKLIKKATANFYENVKVFATATVSELMEKSSIGSVVVRNASPIEVIYNSTNETVINKMKR